MKRLQAHSDYPSVSLLAPTHRTSPANQRDPIVVKNLVAEALDRLGKEFKKRDTAPIAKNLKALVAEIDWAHAMDGLALFASREVATAVALPFRVKARAMVDSTFATRDLVFALNRTPRYRVLVLSEKPTRLFEGAANKLTEIASKPFPLVHKGPGGAAKLPGGPGVNPSAARDEAHRQFFRKVDDAVSAIQEEEKLPIVVAGIERYLAFYHEVTADPGAIVGLISGNHDGDGPAALGKLAWPVFQAGSTRERTRALVRLDEAVSANRHSSGLQQVWRAAHVKRVQTLLVESDFKHPADVSPDGADLLPYTGRGPSALDDAVDEVVEAVLADGGEVFFYEPGSLDLHQRIAAVLRF